MGLLGRGWAAGGRENEGANENYCAVFSHVRPQVTWSCVYTLRLAKVRVAVRSCTAPQESCDQRRGSSRARTPLWGYRLEQWMCRLTTRSGSRPAHTYVPIRSRVRFPGCDVRRVRYGASLTDT